MPWEVVVEPCSTNVCFCLCVPRRLYGMSYGSTFTVTSHGTTVMFP